MESSFDFLAGYDKVKSFYDAARHNEKLYTLGLFSEELTNQRRLAEQIVKAILTHENYVIERTNTFAQNLTSLKRLSVDKRIVDILYAIKGQGNVTAHTLEDMSQEDGKESLLNMYKILLWYARNYAQIPVTVKPYIIPQGKESIYQTAERKLIYIQTADNSSGNWPAYKGLEKIGDASITSFELDGRPNSEDLRKIADDRINQYMRTAGVPHLLQWAELAFRKSDNTWFRDHDVHAVLRRSHIKKTEITEGNEWFETDVETARRAITAVKEGRSSLDLKGHVKPVTITLRPEQKEAVAKTKKVFAKSNRMLWNAKMRFGKTLSALQLVKECKFNHVLIMTHRPVVSDSWYDDFKKLGMPDAGYLYGSKGEGEPLEKLAYLQKPFVYFASIQDLRGSKVFGGIVADKNEIMTKIPWDLVIIDEAHEGTQTELAQKVIAGVVKENTRLLELSGTPFNLLDSYEENQVYTWDYVMEQQAKAQWDIDHPDAPNPYIGLPKVNMFTFEIQYQFKDKSFIDIYDKSFNFREFFRVNEEGRFVYEEKVKQFLDNITTPSSTTHYPFSTKEFRNELRHTLWLMPSVKAAKAMKTLMENHPVFGMEYTIINVVDDGDSDIAATESDLTRVREAITDKPWQTKTITLTVRKLTTGVNVKEWTGVIFLSNTNSSMQYLQAAFRAQTPYSDAVQGMKTNCYIFDFAPDRALTVMADSSRLHTGVGKRVTTKQKEEMGRLLNFLPIIGESGNGMKEFKVDEMLTQLKRAYAEKAVRTGFDDDSLYSDELLMLDNVDLKDFNHLKALVGTTAAEKKPAKIDINKQGLSEEEYEQAEKAKKKKKKERTPEEQAAIDRENALKKQKKAMISILRSISIRIPLMIYGANIAFEDDVSMDTFVQIVDDQSWAEFMPKGVTKELFLRFKKYYDAEVFIEAGHIIRRKVKELDKEDPLERTKELAEIFGTFRNPDKETVLTPWRVVNLHLGKVFGGYSFYDQNFMYTTTDGQDATHDIKTPLTDIVFHEDTHILEINSKTGLYPLYVTTTLYNRQFQKMNADQAGKFTLADEQQIWANILKKNIFVIAKTPMAQMITKRTLAGYHDYDMNVAYVDHLLETLRTSISDGVKLVKGAFGKNMKFDAVVGNPPYQDTTKGDNDTFAPPIYNYFMDLSYKLSDRVTLITPARFLFKAGKTPKDWNDKMLADKCFKVIFFEQDSAKVFPRTDIKGGVVITYRDAKQKKKSIAETYFPAGIYIPFDDMISIMHKVVDNQEFTSFSKIVSPRTAYRFTEKLHKEWPNAIKKLSKGHAYDVSSNIFERLPEIFSDELPIDDQKYIEILGRTNNQRVYKFIREDYISNNFNLNKYKIFIPKATGNGTFGETISSPTIGKPFVGSTETFISVGLFNTNKEAESALKYIKTKFVRAMLSILKVTQDNTLSKWELIPMQDFTPQSDINWTKPVPDIDQQLYRKYGLTQDEIDFIESHVQPME